MFTLPDLPYPYSALEPYIDERTMQIHHDKHHRAYVDNLNKVLEGFEQFSNLPAGKAGIYPSYSGLQPERAKKLIRWVYTESNLSYRGITIEQLLRDLPNLPEGIRTKVRNHGGGQANHSLFWVVMSPNPEGALRQGLRPSSAERPQGESARAINAAFGSFEKFQEQFSNAALSRFGSGWAWLVVDPSPPAGGSGQVKLAVRDTANQDTPLSEGKTPILALDVWEHAYYLKYQNLRGEYIKNWWNVVNWAEVERRFMEVVN